MQHIVYYTKRLVFLSVVVAWPLTLYVFAVLYDKPMIQNPDRTKPDHQFRLNSSYASDLNWTTTVKHDFVSGTGREKMILFWTRYQGQALWWQPSGGYGRGLSSCQYGRCVFTANKSDIRLADLVVIKEKNMMFEKLDWPEYRSQNQLYVHMLTERPGAWHDFLREYNNRINLTMNYRASADISIPGRQLYRVQPPRSGSYKLRIPLNSRPGMAVWAVGNCYPQSRRQDYVWELSKYISVDIYGPCGNFSCPKSADCWQRWERKYKFYLSFENAICDDYITEKFYNPLRYELVPVTLSGHRYNSQLPPHAAINVTEYSSPRTLAAYLVTLANNQTLYAQYFQWKQTFEYRTNQEPRLCKLCQAAHTVSHRPAYTDYHGWWFGACDNGLVDRMRHGGHW